MTLKSISIRNFRCYDNEITVSVDSLTTLIGKNDIGKSSVLDALEIFFNNNTVKIQPEDATVNSGSTDIVITCDFSDLPSHLSIDAGAETSLEAEHLLTREGTLRIQKVFDCNKKTPTFDVFIIAHHPTAPGMANLLDLKEKELQEIVRTLKLEVALKGNPVMRQAIWNSHNDLQLAESRLNVSKPKEDSKRIWEQIEFHLPLFALFQSDRSSQDSDDEVQNPMKAAVTAAIAEVQSEIQAIQQKVQEKVEEIAKNTHEAISSLDPNLAKSLVPSVVPPTPTKWSSLFSVNMQTDGGIPLNKRGSGVRRLVLVSFFKAEAERHLRSGKKRSIIYAIEEPETAQHPSNQRLLIQSLKSLSDQPSCQVLLSTHSPGLASELPIDSIRFLTRDAADNPTLVTGADVFDDVAKALGVMPNSHVKVLVCVEGPTDVTALRCLSSALHRENPEVPDLYTDPRFAFIVLGGSTLQHWVDAHHLRGLGLPEVHIYDSDVPAYQTSVDAVNARVDGSWATRTRKHEIECYLHSDAIKEAYGVEIDVLDQPVDGKCVPKLFAEAYSIARALDGVLKDTTAKKYLAEKAFPLMTAARLLERDPQKEIEGWLLRLANTTPSFASAVGAA